MTKRILCVDDEPGIRQVYEMLPSFLGTDYCVTTTANGDEALAEISASSYDVIVSDLHMPGLSGSDLLKKVAQISPGTARVVVSGFPDELTVAKCLVAGHRYFTKPFSPVTLMGSVRALCEARELASSDRIRQLVGKIEALPTPTDSYVQILKKFSDPHMEIHDVAESLEHDPAVSVKLLQAVNSPLFGVARKVDSIEESIQRIGLNVLKALVLSIHFFSFYQKPGLKFELQKIWEHSSHVAQRARQIAQERSWPVEVCEESFFAGLLHDLGRVVLSACPDEERQALFPEYNPSHDDFSPCFALSHTIDAEAGAYLLALWGIPEPVINAVRTFRFSDVISSDKPSAAAALAVAHELDGAPAAFSGTVPAAFQTPASPPPPSASVPAA